jgi:hypothetical protein
VHAWDEDASPLDPHDDLGVAKLSVAEILRAGKINEVELLAPKTNNATGSFVTLRCDVLSLTSSDLLTLENPSRNENHLCGLLTILVSKAFDIPGQREHAASYVQVWVGKNNPYRDRGSSPQPPQPSSDTNFTFLTKTVANYPGLDPLNPLYDASFHVPLTPTIVQSDPDIVFSLFNGDTVLGTRSIPMASLKNADHCTILETYPMGTSARLEYKVMLHAIQLRANDDFVIGKNPDGVDDDYAAATTERRDMLQVTIVKGYGFVQQKRKKGFFFRKMDIPDVYCCVKVGSSASSITWRTSTVRDTTLPLWNESNIFPISDRGESIDIDVYDESKKLENGEAFIGSCRFTIDAGVTAGGKLDLQLRNQTCDTGAYIVIQCKILEM